MNYLYCVVGVIWLIGALAEIAKMNAKIYRNNIVEPYTGAFFCVWVLLFFTWPYWYFYDKA